MIWLTWRHSRWMIALGILALAVLIPLFVLDANTIQAAWEQHHFTFCSTAGYLPCGLSPIPGETWQWRSLVPVMFTLFPFFVGIFLGAPLLAKEYERGTHLFVWTQSISRTRWLSTTLMLVAGAVVLGFSVLSLVTTWWGPIQDQIASSPWNTFMERGSVPVANALFSLMFGIMIGALMRRSLPAMIVTLLLLIPLQYAITTGYPHLLTPLKITSSDVTLLGQMGRQKQFLFVSWYYADANGHAMNMADTMVYCHIPQGLGHGIGYSSDEIQQCVDTRHLKNVVEYQNFAERFWPLQLVLTAVLLALAALCTGITYWQVQWRLI